MGTYRYLHPLFSQRIVLCGTLTLMSLYSHRICLGHSENSGWILRRTNTTTWHSTIAHSHENVTRRTIHVDGSLEQMHSFRLIHRPTRPAQDDNDADDVDDDDDEDDDYGERKYKRRERQDESNAVQEIN